MTDIVASLGEAAGWVDEGWLVAHAGGWDEALMFGVPIVLAVVGVRYAERRAAAKATDAPDDELPTEDDPPA